MFAFKPRPRDNSEHKMEDLYLVKHQVFYYLN